MVLKRKETDFSISNGKCKQRKKLNIVFATIYSYFCVVSKKEKLIARFLSLPSDFHYNETVKLLGYFGFKEITKGKTSGSRVKFMNEKSVPLMLHKPHPTGIMKYYQLKQVKEVLGL